jgi:hypothetical protein
MTDSNMSARQRLAGKPLIGFDCRRETAAPGAMVGVVAEVKAPRAMVGQNTEIKPAS